MYNSDIYMLSNLAKKKYKNATENTGKYLGRAIVTGFYVIVAIILSYTTGAILYDKYPEVSKIMVSETFSFALALIVFLSGASIDTIRHYIEVVVEGKLHLSVSQLILRGILCNFIVCLGYLTGIKMKTESGKLIMMFFCVFAFIIAGFEHSVANMGVFSIGYFALGGLPMGLVLRNLLWVTIGNIIGGGVLLAGSTLYISLDE